MDELWVRIGVVVAALIIVGLLALLQRRGARRSIRDVESVALDRGIYFFSSASCPTCSRAREHLDTALGEGEYVEVTWEDEPGVFADVGVEAVPAVLVVRDRGRGRLYPGQPERALADL